MLTKCDAPVTFPQHASLLAVVAARHRSSLTTAAVLCPTAIRKHCVLSATFHHRRYQRSCVLSLSLTLLELKLNKGAIAK